MRGLSIFLLVLGAILMILGIVGMVEAYNTGLSGEGLDALFDVSSAFGVTDALSSGHQFQVYMAQYRVILLVAGVVIFVLGLVLLRNSKPKSAV